jgi:hypothetical protein
MNRWPVPRRYQSEVTDYRYLDRRFRSTEYAHVSSFPFQQLRQLVFEHLKGHYRDQYEGIVRGVEQLVLARRLVTGQLSPNDRTNVREGIRQLMWQLLVQNIIVFGMDDANPTWPWYRVTGYGDSVLQGIGAQPHDPDGFMRDFKALNAAADPVVIDYLAESVRAFNHGCPKASLVMLGCASEKAILLLHETFESAISDTAKKAKFEKSYRWTISSKFDALRDGLLRMVDQKRLPKELHESVHNDLIGCFQLIRRQRNAAGHPEIASDVNADGLFLSLRVFAEYVRHIYMLIEHFQKNVADPY